jgi:hypothetical protein
MQNNSGKKIVVALISIVAFVAIIVGFNSRPEVKDTTSTSVEQKETGAFPSTDITSERLSFNGIEKYYYRQALRTATTTPCSIKSPAATSTYTYDALKITTGTSTATVWTFAKATTAFATTTQLGVFSLGSGAQGSMVASTSPSTGITLIDDTRVLAPNTWLVWGVQGTTISGTSKLLGVCSAEFTVL